MDTAPGSARALLCGHARAVAVYRDHRRQVQKEAVLGSGTLLAGLMTDRAAALAALRDVPWLRRLSDGTFRQVTAVLSSGRYRGLIPLRGEDFMPLMELRLPFLADAAVLRHPTHAPAAELLPGLAPLRPRARQIRQVLAESRLDVAVPFRTVDDALGRPVVHGRDAPTLEALAGIAHELGHCLYERARPVRCVRGQLASERVAHRWEEQAVAAYLRQYGSVEERRRWWVCQRRQDALNLHCFLAERAELYGAAHSVPVAPVGLGATGTFRESLYTVPGFQVVYARASLARLPITGPRFPVERNP
jgi:hypothetical protein